MTSDPTAQGPSGQDPGRKRRAFVALVDQGLFSFSNFGLTVVVARGVTTREFGAFSLAMATYLLGTVVLRGLTSETLMVRFSAADPVLWRRAAASAAGAGLALSVTFAAVVALAGALVGGETGAGFIAVALMFPGLAMQDYMRFAALALGRPLFALWNDLTQVILQFGIIGWLIASDRQSVWVLILAWGASAYVAAGLGSGLLHLLPRPIQTLAWFGSQGDLAWRYGMDDLSNQGSTQATSYVVALAAGLQDAGAVRGAQTAFGPSSVITMGVQSAAVPELVRSLRYAPHRFHTEVIGVGLALSMVSALWGCAALLLPANVGEMLFGDTWGTAHPLLVYLTIAKVADGFRVGPTIGLRSMGAARRTLQARWLTTTFGLTFRLVGASVYGAVGFMAADAITRPLEAFVWWHHYQRARREHQASIHDADQIEDSRLS